MSELRSALEHDPTHDMSTFDELDLTLDSEVDHFDAADGRRAWKRQSVVRVVEYSPYPRRAASEHSAVGFTANESRGGVCMLTRETHAVGQSLRLSVREVDGRCRLEAIARVVWCNPEAGDRVAVGLEFLEVRGGAAAAHGPTRARSHGAQTSEAGHGDEPIC